MSKTNKYFVYIGNAYPHKNLERLIDAIVLLNQDREEKIKLKIVSARSIFIERLNKEIRHKNAQDLVELLGFMPEKDLKDLYKNSIAFVFPTLSEGFGLPPMEAIEAETLVLASDIPVLKEVYEDFILYFDPYSVSSIADGLKKVIALSFVEKDKKIKSARAFIKRYSWAKMAEQTLKIYEDTFKEENSDSIR